MSPMRFQPTIDAKTGEHYLPVRRRGARLLKEPLLNKGTAFSETEREWLGLQGLLPAHVDTIEDQLHRVKEQLDTKADPLEKHIYLAALHDTNETLFYRFVTEYLEETVPIIYTPTVAEACRHWSQIYRRERGTYITPQHRGNIVQVLRNRDSRDVSVIVITDNERILGIGDQGAGGMGIPIGKLALYTVAAGIHPARCLPISLDVGTNNQELLDDPLYLGLRRPRLRGEPYWTLVEEVVLAVKEAFPNALFQWEDFANTTSFQNLETYRDVLPSFNDDIEGTAAMVLGGLIAAGRITRQKLADRTYVIAGSGSAGVGIAHLLRAALAAEGVPADEAKSRILVLDSKGLLVAGRPGLDQRKRDLATDPALVASWGIGTKDIDLATVVEHSEASVLIGVAGTPGLFTERIVKAMTRNTERPVIMPLSNPTSMTEAIPSDIFQWSEGRALVATGSPFPDVSYDDRRWRIGQANNVFIFPGVGLGVIVSESSRVTTGMFLAAARALADSIDRDTLRSGVLYPAISAVRNVSHSVAHAVAETAVDEGVAPRMIDVEAEIERTIWHPVYLPYRAV